MYFKLATIFSLAAIAVADDYMVTALAGVSQTVQGVNGALVAWRGDSVGLASIIAQAGGVTKAITAIVAPSSKSPPTDTVLQLRHQAAKALASDVAMAVKSCIAAKPQLDSILVAPVKLGAGPVAKAAQTGFTALATIYLADVPAANKVGEQGIWDSINQDMQTCYNSLQG